MIEVFINIGHSPFSPGGVIRGRTEYGDAKRFTSFLLRELEKYEIYPTVFSGVLKRDHPENSIIISFHRDSNTKNTATYGAYVTVPENADADRQYKAYRLLYSLCKEKGFKYKGVHTYTKNSPFKSIGYTGCPETYLFVLGFMDIDKDNGILDKNCSYLAENFAKSLNEILKERENEDNC